MAAGKRAFLPSARVRMSRNVYILRILSVLAVVMIAFGCLIRHLYVLQVVRHEELYSQAQATYTERRTSTGKRGLIYDRNDHMVVGNVTRRDILAEPRRMPAERRAYIVSCLTEALELPPRLLANRFTSGAVEVVVKRGVAIKQAKAIEELKLPGLRFVDRQHRQYPKHKLLANVVGFTDHNGVGVYGIEQTWDKALAARSGTREFVRDRKGRPILRRSPEAPPPSLNGKNLYLTIDEPIQDIVEQELAALAEKFAPRRAYAIMAEPSTGAILAMAQYPSYNPNERGRMDPEQWRNHLASDVYDPGSTMKAIAITGALDYGIVTLESQIDCESGWWMYARRPLRDSGHSYGVLPVARVIQKSSNIGTAKIALMMGEPRLYQVLRRFGFGARTGVGITPESPGILRSQRNWDRLSITRFPIGQGVSVTPLQMVQAYAAIANSGRMMQLHLVERIEDPRTGKIEVVQPEVKHRAAGARAIASMVAALSMVTRPGGTAKRAAILGYEVAGKTGTSQKCINGTYEGHGKYVASFIGFVPARDPAFVLLILADEPSTGKYYGGTVCAPSFQRIGDEVLRYLNVPPMTPAERSLALAKLAEGRR